MQTLGFSTGIWSGVISELGYVALLMAFVLGVLQCLLPSLSLFFSPSQHSKPTDSIFFNGLAVATATTISQCVMLLVSLLCLMYSFYANDFSLVYVANHSNTLMPWYYKLSATWGGHEGSLLLWVLILSCWCAVFAASCVKKSAPLSSSLSVRMLIILGLVQTCMLALVIFSSSPFDKAFPLPVDGADLNPLLQDPGLIFHPPMLYMGYVGLAVPFAFAVAVLWQGKLSRDEAVYIRPWVIAAWGFLTLGIALGSWWAYYELGWGGWWFWDPVENASLMPWLAATALIHALAVTSKRGVFKAWTVMLGILAFGLSLLGTFLVRSGVLTSVHAFAADPERGLFVLIILGVLVGGALLLFALRGWRLATSNTSPFSLRSRESLLAVNNMLLMTALLVVFLGTLYPIIADAFNLGQVSVGAPYFNALFVPLTWLLLLAMGMSPVLRWQQDTQPLKGAIASIIVTASVWAVIMVLVIQQAWQGIASSSIQLGLTLLLSFWVLGWMGYDIWRKAILSSSSSGTCQKLKHGLKRVQLPYWAMQLAHVGVILCCIGVALTSNLNIEKDRALSVDETVHVAGYDVHFKDINTKKVDNYTAAIATFEVLKQGLHVTTLHPEKRRYMVNRQVMTEAGIDGTLWRDIYIALGEPLDVAQVGQASRRKNANRLEGERWAVRVYVKPMVRWIWLGAILMALSALILIAHACLSRRQR